jgi:hypothetical protein
MKIAKKMICVIGCDENEGIGSKKVSKMADLKKAQEK